MAWKFNPFTGNLDDAGSSAGAAPSGTGIARVTAGVYDTPADVPLQVGFPNRTDTSLAWATNVFTLGKTGTSYTVWVNGHAQTYTVNKQVAVTSSSSLQYVYIDTDNTLKVGTVAWDIAGAPAPVATIFLNASGEYVITDERHSHLRNGYAHKAQHSSVGAFWKTGLSCTFGATNGSISCVTGTMCDEDIEHTFSGTTTTARLVYRASGAWRIANAGADIRPTSSSNLAYDNAGSLDAVSAGQYVNLWVFAVGASTPEIHVLAGQAAYNTLGAAQASTIDSLTLPPWISAESRLLYKAIYQSTAATAAGAYVSSVDMRKIPIAGGVSLSNAFLPLSGGTVTGNVTLSGSTFTMSGNQSSAAWTTSGVKIAGGGSTLTDTTSSGTVAAAYTNSLGGNTIAASNATTYTNYAAMFLGDPVAGTNVTMTNKWSLIAAGAAKFGGAVAYASLTTTARDALATPAAGWTIWNSTNARVETYNGTAWVGSIQAQVPGGSFLG